MHGACIATDTPAGESWPCHATSYNNTGVSCRCIPGPHYRYSIIIIDIHTHTHASHTSDFKRDTVFPQNLTMAIFYFKALFGVVTIRRQLDLEGGVYRDWHAYTYTSLIVSLFVCTYNARVHTYIVVDPLPCGNISGVAFIGVSWQKHVATFWEQWDFKVWRDFQEIYSIQLHCSGLENGVHVHVRSGQPHCTVRHHTTHVHACR